MSEDAALMSPMPNSCGGCCMYRKPKCGRNSGEVRLAGRVTLYFRSAEPDEKPAALTSCTSSRWAETCLSQAMQGRGSRLQVPNSSTRSAAAPGLRLRNRAIIKTRVNYSINVLLSHCRPSRFTSHSVSQSHDHGSFGGARPKEANNVA